MRLKAATVCWYFLLAAGAAPFEGASAQYREIAGAAGVPVVRSQAESSPQAEANRLFVEATLLFRAARALPAAEKEAKYRRISSIISDIVDKYPETLIAKRILSGEGLGELDLDAVDSALSIEKTELQDLIGPASVISVDLAGECDRNVPECLRARQASPDALAAHDYLFRIMDINAAVISFKEFGIVDTAELYFPSSANSNEQLVFVNGTPAVVMAASIDWDLSRISAPGAEALLRRYPEAFVDVARSFLTGHRELGPRRQWFITGSPIMNRCRACENVGVIITRFEFEDGFLRRTTPVGVFGGIPSVPEDQDVLTVPMLEAHGAAVQLALNRIGYEAGQMDGTLGSQTTQALESFQADNCISKTGRPDRATLELLAAYQPTTRPPCANSGSSPAEVAPRIPDGTTAQANDSPAESLARLLPAPNAAYRCSRLGDSISSHEIRSSLVGHILRGYNAKGEPWVERLESGSEGTRQTVFVNKDGTQFPGVYRITGQTVCFSYGTRADWSCKSIARCLEGGPRYVILDEEGAITSTIVSVVRNVIPPPIAAGVPSQTAATAPAPQPAVTQQPQESPASRRARVRRTFSKRIAEARGDIDRFLQSGRGTTADLALALDATTIRTLSLLEDGITLQFSNAASDSEAIEGPKVDRLSETAVSGLWSLRMDYVSQSDLTTEALDYGIANIIGHSSMQEKGTVQIICIFEPQISSLEGGIITVKARLQRFDFSESLSVSLSCELQ